MKWTHRVLELLSYSPSKTDTGGWLTYVCLQERGLTLSKGVALFGYIFVPIFNQVEKHSKELAAIMVTYPSTNGVFEEGIRYK